MPATTPVVIKLEDLGIVITKLEAKAGDVLDVTVDGSPDDMDHVLPVVKEAAPEGVRVIVHTPDVTITRKHFEDLPA